MADQHQHRRARTPEQTLGSAAAVVELLVERNLLRAHNLLLTPAPERRIVLVDYDIVRRGRLYRLIYFAVRWMLFWRDHADPTLGKPRY